MNPGALVVLGRELREVAGWLEATARGHGRVSRRLSDRAEDLALAWTSPRGRRFDGDVRAVLDRVRGVPDALWEAAAAARRLAVSAERYAGEMGLVQREVDAREQERVRAEQRRDLAPSPGLQERAGAEVTAVQQALARLAERGDAARDAWERSVRRETTLWRSVTQDLRHAGRVELGPGGGWVEANLPTRTGAQRRDATAVAVAVGAARFARRLVGASSTTIEEWGRLADMLERHDGDARFAVAFVTEVGTHGLVGIPASIDAAWREHEGGRLSPDTAPAWEALMPVGRVLATASWTIGHEGGLPPGLVADLVAQTSMDPSRVGPAEPAGHLGHVGLLFSPGGFSDDLLQELAVVADTYLPRLAWHTMRLDRPGSPWEAMGEPVLPMFAAISESALASAARPRLFAQLMAAGMLDDQTADVATMEAGRRSNEETSYLDELLDELDALELFGDGGEAREQARDGFRSAIAALALAVDVAEATSDTIGALQARASRAGQELSSGRTPQIRSAAGRTLRDTPRGLKAVTGSRLYPATRALPAVGAGLTAWDHLDRGRGPLETTVRTGASTAGAGAAAAAVPALAGGPVAYGVAVLAAGVAGGALGDVAVRWIFDRPSASWLRTVDREQAPSSRDSERTGKRRRDERHEVPAGTSGAP